MLKFIQWLLLQLRSDTLKLLILAGVLLLVWGTFAPVGTLVWWMNQSVENLGLTKNRTQNLPNNDGYNKVIKSANIDCYVVFLPGVGDFSADELTKGEEFFLNRLVQLHPNCVKVSDVFPYSVTDRSLGGQGLLAPLWRAAENAHGWLENADVLIKIRNLWRFAISVDARYGPIYNRGIAIEVIRRMNAAYPLHRNTHQPIKVILIGTSGGVQVALGAASYLHRWLKQELIVVSIGGDFDGNTGFDAVKHVYHLHGQKDWIEEISSIVFPSRWPWTVGSPFNQARQQGRYTVIFSGPQAHNGSQGYFGTKLVKGSQTTYVQLTLQKVNQLPIWSDLK